MADDMLLPFSLPAVCRKKITAAYDGSRLSSDAGVLLLACADRRLGLVDALAGLIPDHRSPAHVTHDVAAILRARIFAIACGYPDADDLDHLRQDPAFKLACGRLPESGADLASQPTISRLENAPDLRTLLRLGRAMVAMWCRGHHRPPKAITLMSTIPSTGCMGISSISSRRRTKWQKSAAIPPPEMAMLGGLPGVLPVLHDLGVHRTEYPKFLPLRYEGIIDQELHRNLTF